MQSTPPTWRKSRRCTPKGGDCVEVAPGGGVRDSKDRGVGPEFWVGSQALLVFTEAIKSGQFDQT